MSADASALLSRAAEAGVHRLALPTPFAVGDVNTYLIDDDPLTLVDAGPNSGTSLVALEAALAAHGRRIEDLQLLVISHEHADHLGLTGILQQRSGADVAALDAFAPHVADFGAYMERSDAFSEALMRRHGLTNDIIYTLRSISSLVRSFGGSADVTVPLISGETLSLRDRTLEISHRPGHSQSDTVLHDRGHRLLLSADHLIERISSIALVTPPLTGEAERRPAPLVQYMASLRETQATTDVDVVLTGHGEPLAEYVQLIDERFVMHARRAEKILGLLEKAGAPQTAHEIAQAMWGNVAITQAFLTLSEVLGHVDLLLADGRAVEVDDGDVTRFAVS